jgi:hypothetical protein
MATTKEIPRDQWKEYFDRFTKKHLRDNRPEVATIELVSAELGDQIAADARILGISYDPKSEALEVLLESVDHLVFHPREVWVLEDDDGFLPSVEILREDGSKEILSLRRNGPPAPRT